MRLSDLRRRGDDVRRQRDHRLGIAGAERTGPGKIRVHLRSCCARRQRAVDQQRLLTPRRGDASPSAFEESPKCPSAAFAIVMPAAIACPPPFAIKSGSDRPPDSAAEIDPGNRAARAGADVARTKRNGKSRPAEPLLEARGDEADDAGMPAGEAVTTTAPFSSWPSAAIASASASRDSRNLDRLPLGIEAVELGGERGRLDPGPRTSATGRRDRLARCGRPH